MHSRENGHAGRPPSGEALALDPAPLLQQLAALLGEAEPLHVVIERGGRRVELTVGVAEAPPGQEERPRGPVKMDLDAAAERARVNLGKPAVNGDGGRPGALRAVETDILDLLRREGRRLRMEEIYSAFSPGKEPEWSESTLSHALAEMTKRRGLLTNVSAGRRDGHGVGYGLAEWQDDGRAAGRGL